MDRPQKRKAADDGVRPESTQDHKPKKAKQAVLPAAAPDFISLFDDSDDDDGDEDQEGIENGVSGAIIRFGDQSTSAGSANAVFTPLHNTAGQQSQARPAPADGMTSVQFPTDTLGDLKFGGFTPIYHGELTAETRRMLSTTPSAGAQARTPGQAPTPTVHTAPPVHPGPIVPAIASSSTAQSLMSMTAGERRVHAHMQAGAALQTANQITRNALVNEALSGDLDVAGCSVLMADNTARMASYLHMTAEMHKLNLRLQKIIDDRNGSGSADA